MKKAILLVVSFVALLGGCRKSDMKTKTVIGSLQYASPTVDGLGGYYNFHTSAGIDSTILVEGYYEGHYEKRNKYEIYRNKKSRLVYTETGMKASPPCLGGNCSFSVVKAVSFTIIP